PTPNVAMSPVAPPDVCAVSGPSTSHFASSPVTTCSLSIVTSTEPDDAHPVDVTGAAATRNGPASAVAAAHRHVLFLAFRMHRPPGSVTARGYPLRHRQLRRRT